uniref:Putative deoxyribonuclease i n=1 Tax=Culex tarsalis TaxID=7177 RepID=A0A1Q3FS01_CULTA
MKIVLAVALALLVAIEAREIPRQDIIPFAPACSININTQLPRPQPLILIPGTDQFRYPQSNDRMLNLNNGESLELACETGFNVAPMKKSIVVSCIFDRSFGYDGATFQFNEFSCDENWFSAARRTNVPCEQGATIVEVGFDMGTRFPKIMDICHNYRTFENHWIKHEFHVAHDGFQQGVPRPDWHQGDFQQGVNVNLLYTVNRQRQTLAQILGSQALADQLVIDATSGIFMARGHIAARADFIYGTQQNATFWFLNAAPQWQNFNDGNWLRIEDSARSFVASRNLRVTVYGGTYGVHTQTDANGDQQPIYLDFDPNGIQRLPSPKIYYKILHDEQNKAGIVLIGVNDIHITSMERIRNEYMFCEDIGDKVSWINWDRFNLALGFSYACEVNQFLRKIGHLPQLDIPNLLI